LSEGYTHPSTNSGGSFFASIFAVNLRFDLTHSTTLRAGPFIPFPSALLGTSPKREGEGVRCFRRGTLPRALPQLTPSIQSFTLPQNMKILHLSDLHLGQGSPGDPRGAERLNSLARLGTNIPDINPDVILVAGDTFDSPRVEKAVVHKASQIMESAKKKNGERIPIVIIPGNHDPSEADGLWGTFQGFLSKNSSVHLVLTPTVVSLCHGKLLVEAYPCETRYSPEPPWEKPLNFQREPADVLRIVLAHGTLVGGPVPDGENDAYPFTLQDVEALSADYVALGHFHGVYPEWVGENDLERIICYSGTHEPDQFSSDSGWAILANIERGNSTRLRRIRVGHRTWRLFEVHNPMDIQKVEGLREEVENDIDPRRFVIRINIGSNARLSQAEVEALEGIESTLRVLGAQVESRGKVHANVNIESLDISSLPSGAVKQALLALQDELSCEKNPDQREVISAAIQMGWERARQ